MNNKQNKELLFDIQTVIDSLKDTKALIMHNASKNATIEYLTVDANLLKHIIICLHNGGYDND